jgi:hypothetical protein
MSWEHPKTWLAEAVTVAKLNKEIRDKFEALKNPPHAEYAPAYAAGTLISTSSASFVTMTNFELTLETTGGDVLIVLNLDVDSAAYFDIEVNNARKGGADGFMGTGAAGAILIILLLRDVEPQTLTIVGKWKVPSGTTNILATTRPYFSAREIS